MVEKLKASDAKATITSSLEDTSGSWSGDDRAAIARLRALYPKLADWDTSVLGFAFGSFCNENGEGNLRFFPIPPEVTGTVGTL